MICRWHPQELHWCSLLHVRIIRSFFLVWDFLSGILRQQLKGRKKRKEKKKKKTKPIRNRLIICVAFIYRPNESLKRFKIVAKVCSLRPLRVPRGCRCDVMEGTHYSKYMECVVIYAFHLWLSTVQIFLYLCFYFFVP